MTCVSREAWTALIQELEATTKEQQQERKPWGLKPMELSEAELVLIAAALDDYLDRAHTDSDTLAKLNRIFLSIHDYLRHQRAVNLAMRLTSQPDHDPEE